MNRLNRVFHVLGLAGLFLCLAASSCGPGESIEIGVLLPLTGDSQVYGESVRKGIELGHEILQQDEELTYDIAISYVDTRSDAAEAARLAEELFATALTIIGGVTSEEALAMVDATKASGKVLLSPTASSSKLSRISRTSFRLFTTTLQEASVMATFADDTLDSRRITIVRQPGDPGDSFAKEFATAFENAGGEIAAVLDVSSVEEAEQVATDTIATQPNAVYIAAQGMIIPAVIKALRTQGFGSSSQQWILSTSSFSLQTLIDAAGADAQDVYITQSIFDLSREEGAMPRFVAAYREKYDEDPDLYAGHGYDSVILLGEATKKIINTFPSEFLKGLRSVEPLAGATGLALQFNESGDAQKFPRIHWIDNGIPRDFQKLMAERQEALREEMDALKRETEILRREGSGNS